MKILYCGRYSYLYANEYVEAIQYVTWSCHEELSKEEIEKVDVNLKQID